MNPFKKYNNRRQFCIMGCSRDNGHLSHIIPRDPKRRAEWFRILGVTSKVKTIYLCGAHLAPNSTFGKRIHKYALPIPREKEPPNTAQIPQNDHTTDLSPESTYTTEQIVENQTETSTTEQSLQNQTAKPEVFELRDPINGNRIAVGRYYQNNEFLMSSYTQTNKLTHQQQVFLLNHKYEGQLKILARLKRENYRLTKATRRHKILFSQLRKIQAKNQILRENIKKYKKISKKLQTRLKYEKL